MGLPGHVSHTLEGQHSLQAGRAAPYLLTDLETAFACIGPGRCHC